MRTRRGSVACFCSASSDVSLGVSADLLRGASPAVARRLHPDAPVRHTPLESLVGGCLRLHSSGFGDPIMAIGTDVSPRSSTFKQDEAIKMRRAISLLNSSSGS
jgi:hypothetical protein